MKAKENMFAQMRSATSALLRDGPLAATGAIQNALQRLRPAPNATQSTQAHPMHDINSPPQPEVARGASGDAAAQAQSLADLMPNLRTHLKAAGAAFETPSFGTPTFNAPAFDLSAFEISAFEMPGLAPNRRAPDAAALPGKFVDNSYTNRAGTRAFKLYIPSRYEGQALPLIVMLHGCTQDPDDFAVGTQMNVLAEEMDCFVVYPAQSQQANSSRCWNWFNALDQQRDQGEPSIIAGITRTVMASHGIDPGQVYVAGLSAGGAMAAIMGTLYPDLYGAVGVHSGLPFASAHDLPSALAAMQGNFGRARQSGGTLPIIVFHGDKDTTVHPVNGDEVIAQRAQRASDAMVKEPGRVPDGHAYTRTVHRRADGTPHAEQWLIHGAGHAWSGGSKHGSYTDGKGPDASREMLRFFRTAR